MLSNAGCRGDDGGDVLITPRPISGVSEDPEFPGPAWRLWKRQACLL